MIGPKTFFFSRNQEEKEEIHTRKSWDYKREVEVFLFFFFFLIIKYMSNTAKEIDTNTIQEKYQEDQIESAFAEDIIEHAPEGTASPGKALFMLLKAFIGTGVIFLPGS